MIVLTTLVFLVQFTPLFSTESVKGREKEAQIASHHPLMQLNEKLFIPRPPLYFAVLFRPQIRGLSFCSLLKKTEAGFLHNVSIMATILA